MSVNETILLKRFISGGDAEAFAEIVKSYAPMVYGVCLRILADKDKSADTVQDTFTQLVRDAASIRGSLAGWLHRVATNRAIDLIRRDSSQKHHQKEYAENIRLHSPQEDKVSWQEISACIDKELNRLDNQLREILVLRFFQGLTTVEIAEKCGLSQSTVSRRIETGVVTLRHNLKLRGLVVSVAFLAALLDEHIVLAVPAAVMKELGKIAIAGAYTAAVSSGTAIKAGITVGMTVKAKIIITSVAAAAIATGSAVVLYQHHSKQAEQEQVQQQQEVVQTQPESEPDTNAPIYIGTGQPSPVVIYP